VCTKTARFIGAPYRGNSARNFASLLSLFGKLILFMIHDSAVPKIRKDFSDTSIRGDRLAITKRLRLRERSTLRERSPKRPSADQEMIHRRWPVLGRLSAGSTISLRSLIKFTTYRRTMAFSLEEGRSSFLADSRARALPSSGSNNGLNR